MTRLASLSCAALLALSSAGCIDDLCDIATCNVGGGGADTSSTSFNASTSSTEASSSTGVSPTCIPSDPAWAPSPECGIFVRQGAAGTGTPDAPVGSVLEALAANGGKPIYIAEGTYTAELSLPSGTILYGGLKADWAFDAATRPVLTGMADVIPVRLAAGANTTELHHLKVEAADAEADGGSSIAMIVEETPSRLDSVELVSGNGEAGAPSMTPNIDIGPSDPGDDTIEGKKGFDANTTTPNLANPGAPSMGNTLCPASIGGKGGDGGSVDGSASAAADGSRGEPFDMACAGNACGRGGAGEDDDMFAVCDPGQNGREGVDGPNGPAATTLGELNPSGYRAPESGSGMPGSPGQGGGGGGGAMGVLPSTRGASGGSGGAGGCGGNGALGGQGGGSSIALVLLGTPPEMTNVTLAVGTGGDGGAGANGQFGVTGGTGGAASTGLNGSSGSCIGGSGGKGGDGGHGAGGRGGHAIGIAFNGQTPGSGFMVTAEGSPGQGGMSSGNAGIPGASEHVLDFTSK